MVGLISVWGWLEGWKQIWLLDRRKKGREGGGREKRRDGKRERWKTGVPEFHLES